jgi:hypothetical protein
MSRLLGRAGMALLICIGVSYVFAHRSSHLTVAFDHAGSRTRLVASTAAQAPLQIHRLPAPGGGQQYLGGAGLTPAGGFDLPVETQKRAYLVRVRPTGASDSITLPSRDLPKHYAISPNTIVSGNGTAWFPAQDEHTLSTSFISVSATGAVTTYRLPPLPDGSREILVTYLAPAPANGVAFVAAQVGNNQQWLGRIGASGVVTYERLINGSGRGSVVSFIYNAGQYWFVSTNDPPGQFHSYSPDTGDLTTYQVALPTKLDAFAAGSGGSLWLLASSEAADELAYWTPSGNLDTVPLSATDNFSFGLSSSGSQLAAIDYEGDASKGVTWGALTRVDAGGQIQRCPLPHTLALYYIVQATNGVVWLVAGTPGTTGPSSFVRIASGWCG